ncbi:histidine phosphatase family protein [Nocardioidaceae bacterium]|nr:histidine phosphatase family protein [Nocardioidaceae bacterium]
MSEPRRLVLLRHGRTAWNAERRAQGHSDVALDEVGRAQAEATGPVLGAMRPDVVWSSDLSRALETGSAVARAAAVTLTVDERLRERSLGVLEGLTYDELAAQRPDDLAAWEAGGRSWAALPGAETDADLAARYCAAVADVVGDLTPGGLAVVAAHGACTKVGLGVLTGLGESFAREAGVLDNCGWVELLERTDRPRSSAVESAEAAVAGEAGRWRLMAYNRSVASIADLL